MRLFIRFLMWTKTEKIVSQWLKSLSSLAQVTDAVTHISRKPGNLWHSWQTSVSPTRHWCSRDAGSQDCVVKEASTQISNASLRWCVVWNTVRFPERSMCETARATPMMLTWEAWRTKESWKAAGRAHPREKCCRPQLSKLLDQSYQTLWNTYYVTIEPVCWAQYFRL